jgi:carbon-monoxide dehydrogenase iron sulfur subunit
LIKYKKELCTGCRICEVVCSMNHLGKINPKEARIQYNDNWPHIGQVNFCRQCAKKACIDACNTGALSLSEDGRVVIDRELCTGCLECSEACIFGVLPSNGSYPLFCDTCDGSYECIKWCPTKALLKVSDNR